MAFAPSSLILANYILPINRALCFLEGPMRVLFFLLLAHISFQSIAVTQYESSELEKYMSRTKANDLSYENKTHSLIIKNSEFIVNCWDKLAPLSFYLFYTIDLNGKASDIVWFPKDIDASCLKKRILSISYPKPATKFYGGWLIWDGVGG